MLAKMNTGAVSTVHSNWKHYSTFLSLTKGQTVSKHTPTMLALSWKDKWQVFMLSTVHSASLLNQTRNRQRVPKVISIYISNMGLVDKCDMQIFFTENCRKTLKWYKKLFFHFLDITIYNSYVLYKNSKQKYGNARKPLGRPGADHHVRLTE